MHNTSVDIKLRAPLLSDCFALLKPRVMSLVVFTAAIGLLVAPGVMDPVRALLSVVFIAIGGGASGALNMWWDADIDAVMRRTAARPVPAGRVTPEFARNFGLGLSVLAVVMLGLVANWAAGALLAFTIFFYVVIYSMWLKRLTPLNIVIGGASGAFPPMIGWVAATGGFGVEPFLMFSLVFMWTPPHFWALALFMQDDYSRAGVPMLTVTHGRRETRKQILVYTVLLAATAMTLAFTSIGGPIYLLISLVMNGAFLKGAWQLYSRDEDSAEQDRYNVERKFFRLSLFYLFVHFIGLYFSAMFNAAGMNWIGWPVFW